MKLKSISFVFEDGHKVMTAEITKEGLSTQSGTYPPRAMAVIDGVMWVDEVVNEFDRQCKEDQQNKEQSVSGIKKMFNVLTPATDKTFKAGDKVLIPMSDREPFKAEVVHVHPNRRYGHQKVDIKITSGECVGDIITINTYELEHDSNA
jgi:hypothetical protein